MSKKARQKGKGVGATSRKSTDARPVTSTPTRKERKLPSLPSTPSTMTSKSTTESKRAASMMSSLALKTPPKKKRSPREQDVANKASLSDTVNLDDAAMIDWTSTMGIQAALEHHFDDHEDLEGLDFHARVILLCNKFNPADIRPVYQGIVQEAGKDWRTLKVQRHRSMKALAPEFAKECVNIVNAKAVLLKPESCTVPKNITIKKEKGVRSATA